VLIVITLLPLMTSVVVRSYGWMILLANNGLVNTLLGTIGLPPARLMFNLTGVVIALTEVLMPYMVLTLVGVLQNVDAVLEDAARSLGASRWWVFVDVLLPLSVPGIAAGSLLVFGQALGAFATPSLVGGAATQVMSTTIGVQAISVLNWPFASSTSFILMMLVLVLTVVQGRLLKASARRV
jgi:putative spermidine/putrescine transport system permease protein